MDPGSVLIGTGPLRAEDVVRVARTRCGVRLADDALAEIARSRDVIEHLAKDDRPRYGVSTGEYVRRPADYVDLVAGRELDGGDAAPGGRVDAPSYRHLAYRPGVPLLRTLELPAGRSAAGRAEPLQPVDE